MTATAGQVGTMAMSDGDMIYTRIIDGDKVPLTEEAPDVGSGRGVTSGDLPTPQGGVTSGGGDGEARSLQWRGRRSRSS